MAESIAQLLLIGDDAAFSKGATLIFDDIANVSRNQYGEQIFASDGNIDQLFALDFTYALLKLITS